MSTAEKTKKLYYPEWRCYKPNGSGNGAASKVQVCVVDVPHKNGNTYKEVQAFLVSAQQTGTDQNDNASFGWDDVGKHVTMKLGEVDLGELLSVLNCQKEYAGPPAKEGGKPNGLFHKNSKGNSSLQFAKMAPRDANSLPTYWLRLSSKVGSTLTEVKHSISVAEAEILRIVLDNAVRVMYSV